MIDIEEATYISQLDEAKDLSASDLILISKLEQTSTTQEYVSRKTTYETLSSILVGDVDSKISSKVNEVASDLSSKVAGNSANISALSAKHDVCESAVVKIANCVNQCKSDIQVLSARIARDELSCLSRDQQLCAALNSTSAYLSTASKYISSQVSANYKKLTGDIQYLSTQHNWLSTQLSTQLTSRVLQLSTSLSNTVKANDQYLSAAISRLSGDLSDTNDKIDQLEIRVDNMKIPDFTDKVNQLSHDMYDEDGNVGVLCARVFQEDQKNMRLFGAYANMAEAQAARSQMRNGDVVVIDQIEYYLSGANFYKFGPDDIDRLQTSAVYWNQTYNTVNSNNSRWNWAYNTLQENYQTWSKLSVVSKTQLANAQENPPDDPNLVLFCTDA